MCYIVPTVAGVVSTVVWRKAKSPKLLWLTLLFYGGAIFGIVDHLWHGELFLVSENWLADIALGVVITLVIILSWIIVSLLSKTAPGLLHTTEVKQE